MKAWVDLGATQRFWTRDQRLGYSTISLRFSNGKIHRIFSFSKFCFDLEKRVFGGEHGYMQKDQVIERAFFPRLVNDTRKEKLFHSIH